MVLKSPRFLYHGLRSSSADQFDRASRLSFAIWDSSPDAALWTAAKDNQLGTTEQLLHQAERMALDSRFRFKLRQFLLQWMKLDQIAELNKSADQFPGFSGSTSRDARTSFCLFLDEVIASDDCDFRRLFLSDVVFLNGRLAKIYRANLADDARFQPVRLDDGQRAGVLTHPFVMSAFSDATTTSPIRRGVFLARGVLGRALLPPPDAFVPLAPSLHPDLTTRERVILQTAANACQTCHAMINPLGFPLEHFDAIGRYRAQEGSRPVDVTGGYTSRRGQSVNFAGARELAAYLSNSEEAHAALVGHLFRYAVQHPARAYGPESSAQLTAKFTASHFNMRKLLIEMGCVAAAGPPTPMTDHKN